MIQQNTDSIIEENEPINSVSVQKGLNSFNFKVRKIQCDLNLLVTSVNGKPINNALISLDSAGLTWKGNYESTPCRKICFRRYFLWIYC
jgi:hypothetical protein